MQPFFPISYSTLSQDALSDFITVNYRVGLARCRFLVRGVGDTYLVEADHTKYIFRVYRATHRGLPVIASEMTLLTKLKEAGVSVSYPIPDKKGELIQPFNVPEGTRYGVLFSFAEGKVINAPDETQLKSLGHEMAKFHSLSSSIKLDGVTRKFDLQTTLFDPLEKTKHFFASDPEGYGSLCQTAKKIEHELAAIDTDSFSKGYCHYDFLPKNFHFDGAKVTFFDFDFLGYGWLVNDLMIFWQHLCLDIFFNRTTKESAIKNFRIFINAYREIKDLKDEELNIIPLLSPGFWLFYMQFHSTHDQFYPLIFEPATLKMRTGLIRQLIANNWYWPEELM
ncbi:MAG: hypothetical protein DI535_16040 [Citrobacter freundii]|nr:MAG: hypothetical protein DI535_16040 [Citrobacter freundii]